MSKNYMLQCQYYRKNTLKDQRQTNTEEPNEDNVMKSIIIDLHTELGKCK